MYTCILYIICIFDQETSLRFHWNGEDWGGSFNAKLFRLLNCCICPYYNIGLILYPRYVSTVYPENVETNCFLVNFQEVLDTEQMRCGHES